nr:hypothetical protein [Frigoribacterium sp. PvP032]
MDGFSADIVTGLLPLGLDVDPVKPEGVLVDDPIDALVTSPTNAFTALLSTSVPHLEEKVDEGLFEEVGVALTKTVEELSSHFSLNTADAIFDLLDLLDRVEDVGSCLDKLTIHQFGPTFLRASLGQKGAKISRALA